MPITEMLKKANKVKPKTNPPWEGPGGQGSQGGVTYSLLSHYLTCRERFRIYTIEGLTAADSFSKPMEFGSMWHICEAELAAGREYTKALTDYAGKLCTRYPTQQEQVDACYGVCLTEFPHYAAYWDGKLLDPRPKKTLLQETSFDVPYSLPSGRIIRLRGKWDGVNLIGKGKEAGAYLFETKTKGDIDEGDIKRQITFDLQTMLYLQALLSTGKDSADPGKLSLWNAPIRGIDYNVVKRPGQYQGKKETRAGFLSRLSGIIAGSPGEFFYRWRIEVSPADIQNFRRMTLDPLLENLLDDYEWWRECLDKKWDPFDYRERASGYPQHRQRHYRHPYGVRNVLDKGGSTDLDHYLDSGSMMGLDRVTSLFKELE
jgi:hypothetical protein